MFGKRALEKQHEAVLAQYEARISELKTQLVHLKADNARLLDSLIPKNNPYSQPLILREADAVLSSSQEVVYEEDEIQRAYAEQMEAEALLTGTF